MLPSKGDDLEHPVTEQEAVRSVLVQGLPLLDQELTESSIVQVHIVHGVHTYADVHLGRRDGAHTRLIPWRPCISYTRLHLRAQQISSSLVYIDYNFFCQ